MRATREEEGAGADDEQECVPARRGDRRQPTVGERQFHRGQRVEPRARVRCDHRSVGGVELVP